MYVMEHYASRRDENGGLHGPWVTTLWEMTKAELREAELKAEHSLFWYEIVPAYRAHAWVKQGGHHTTPLYIDWTESGLARIRYARDMS